MDTEPTRSSVCPSAQQLLKAFPLGLHFPLKSWCLLVFLNSGVFQQMPQFPFPLCVACKLYKHDKLASPGTHLVCFHLLWITVLLCHLISSVLKTADHAFCLFCLLSGWKVNPAVH